MKTPLLGPKTFHKHLVISSRKRGKAKRLSAASLMLTPMVDMFSLLVIFLLQVFSANPEVVTLKNGIVVPRAESGVAVKDAPVLSLTKDDIFFGDEKIGAVEALALHPEPLLQRLHAWHTTHKGTAINLAAHESLPSHTVSRVIAMLPSAEFSSVQLVVMGGAQ